MNEHSAFARVATPLGEILLAATGDALVYAQFVDRHVVEPPRGASEHARHRVLMRASAALERYFAGDTGKLDVPLAPHGTPFQRDVWDAILALPWGDVATYTQIAQAVGAPRAVRAVGAATGRNPLCLFIPCHRVVGARGALTGYAGGIERKRALLALEAHGAGPAEQAVRGRARSAFAQAA